VSSAGDDAVIFLSGSSTVETLAGFAAGADDYVAKPSTTASW
jgi:DNA-binding response OmpR family regulator